MAEEEAKSAENVDAKTVISDFMRSQDYIDLINAEKGKIIENFRKEKLPGLIDEQVDIRIKAKETKTPEQLKFAEYESQLADLKNKIGAKELIEKRSINKDSARVKFKEAKLPDSLLEFFVTEDEEATNLNVDKAIKELNIFRDAFKEDVFIKNNIKVPGKTVTDENAVTLSRAEFDKLDLGQRSSLMSGKDKPIIID